MQDDLIDAYFVCTLQLHYNAVVGAHRKKPRYIHRVINTALYMQPLSHVFPMREGEREKGREREREREREG